MKIVMGWRGHRVLDERRKSDLVRSARRKDWRGSLSCTAQCEKRREDLGVETRESEYLDRDGHWHAGTLRSKE
jgi:hypothetical protein